MGCSDRVLGGVYRLERRLARGGMGEVWRATVQGRPVALKLVVAESAKARARFVREARVAARLHSRHVVRVLDAGVDGELSFLAMELLAGEDLRARLRREGRLSLDAAARIAREAGRALELAAESRIVHRDLKPSNVFLARVGAREIVKLLDFGLAKELEQAGERTASGVVLGSAHYMSPEQARGQRVDARSDLWSLAVVLFELLTGERPFGGVALGDVLVRVCTDPIPAATRLRPSLPPAIDAFFEQALAREKAQRFQSARALAVALDGIALEGESAWRPSSRPPPSHVRPRRQMPLDEDVTLTLAPLPRVAVPETRVARAATRARRRPP